MTNFKSLLGGAAAAAAVLLSPCGHGGVYNVYNFSSTGSGTYSASWSGSQAIPDNTAAGVAYALNFAGSGAQIHDISVKLNLSGGWNGDCYAYLSHGSGFAVLLNRVGASASNPDGYGTSGMNIVLTTGTLNSDIHGVQIPATGGSYQADGRINYTDTTRNHTLDVFRNLDPHGGWTLFFADRGGGDVSTLTGWSVELSAVPEPVNVALGVFGVLLVAGQGSLWWRARARGAISGARPIL